jgi:hypothetical protein
MFIHAKSAAGKQFPIELAGVKRCISKKSLGIDERMEGKEIL